MGWMRKLGRSFRFAWAGIVGSVKGERNLRIHLAVTCYVTWAGILAGLDGPRWAAVLLCCGTVIAAELWNTALEHLCDALSPEKNPHIAAAKDGAAGGVLVLAMTSVAVAAAVFGPWIRSGGLLRAQTEYQWLLPAALVSIPPAILWIRGSKKWELKNRA